jgi:glutathione synthase/RimK-type ligase-like ATP-grasp enzyme
MTKGRIFLTLSEKSKKSKEINFHIDDKVGGRDYLFWIDEFKNLDYDIYFVNWRDYKDKKFSRVFHYNSSQFVSINEISRNDFVFLYKQEGFLLDRNIKKFYRMLDELEETGALIVNNPKTIRWNISKEHLFYLMKNGVKVINAYEVEDVLYRINSGEKFVVKPKIAARANGLRLIKSKEDIEWVNNLGKNMKSYIAQEFCRGIREGERSLFFIGDKYSHAVLKTPNPENPNEIRCNKSVGGIVSKYEPSAEELNYAKKVIEVISKEYPILYSRIDFAIDNGTPVLVEAELLNPSAFADLAGVGEMFGKNLVNYFDKLIRERELSQDL